MRLTNRKALAQFVEVHADATEPILEWVTVVEEAQWQKPADIRTRFAAASFLSGNRVIFNIKGNRYRLVVIVVYARGLVHVLWVGSHAEYDRLRL